MQVVPWIFGIAHPTGFPAFVLLGGLFAHAVPLGSVAWRLSAFTAIAVTLSAAVLYRIAARATGTPAIACGSALLFVAARTVWEHATRAEVHGLSLCFCTIAFALAYEWSREGRRRWLLGAAVALGLGLATHPVAVWALPGVLLLAFGARRPAPGLATTSIALFVMCAVVPYGYLPLRSAQVFAAHRDPTLALGFPPGMPFWDYAHPAVLRNFWWLVSGRQFATHTGFAAYVHPMALVRTVPSFAVFAMRQLGVVGSLLALGGIIEAARRAPRFAASLVLFGAAGIPFALHYTEEADPLRYLLTALWSAALFSAFGASWVAASLERLARSPQRSQVTLRSRLPRLPYVPLIGAALMCLAGAHAYLNRIVIAIDRDDTARKYVAATLAASPPRTIVISPWIYAPPLAYAAYVQQDFGARILVTAAPQTLWGRIAMWSATRCVLVVNDVPLAPPTSIKLETRSPRAPYIFRVDSRSRFNRARSRPANRVARTARC